MYLIFYASSYVTNFFSPTNCLIVWLHIIHTSRRKVFSGKRCLLIVRHFNEEKIETVGGAMSEDQ